MEPTVPLHPAIVHLPMGIAVILPLIALGLMIAIRRDRLPARAWWLVVALNALLLAGGVVAVRTGEADEHRVERIVPERIIEEHEEAAELFLVGAGFALSLALAVPFLRSARAARAAMGAASAASILAAVLTLRVGHAGGELVYRHGAAQVYAPGPSAGATHATQDRDHD